MYVNNLPRVALINVVGLEPTAPYIFNHSATDTVVAKNNKFLEFTVCIYFPNANDKVHDSLYKKSGMVGLFCSRKSLSRSAISIK